MALEAHRWDGVTEEDLMTWGNAHHVVTLKNGKPPWEGLAAVWQIDPQSRALSLIRVATLPGTVTDEAGRERPRQAPYQYKTFADGEWANVEVLEYTYDLEAMEQAEAEQ